MLVHLLKVWVKFVCQGHQVNVKVTGAENRMYTSVTEHTSVSGPPSIKRQSCV